MALTAAQMSDINALASSTFDKLSAKTDQFREASALVSIMTKKPRLEHIDGGRDIQVPIQIRESRRSGSISGTTDILNANVDQIFSYATFDHKHYTYDVTYTYDEQVRASQSKEAIIDLISAKIASAAATARRDLAIDLHGSGSDDGGLALNGLADVFAPGGTSYGGLTNTDLDDPNLWLTKIDTSVQTVTYASLAPLINELINRGQGEGGDESYKPDVIISSPYIQSKFLSSQQSQQRFTSEEDLKAGFDGCFFNNIKWYADSYTPGSKDGTTGDNWLYVLSTPTFSLKYVYGFEGKNSPMDTSTRLPNQPLQTIQKFMTRNLICRARRYNGVFKNLV